MAENKPSRRRFPRIPSGYEIGVRSAKEKNKGIPSVSTVHDVGLGGCRFVSKEQLGVGSLLSLTILPKRSIVEAEARVVYELPMKEGTFEVGVEFLEISQRDKATLEKILSAPVA